MHNCILWLYVLSLFFFLLIVLRAPFATDFFLAAALDRITYLRVSKCLFCPLQSAFLYAVPFATCFVDGRVIAGRAGVMSVILNRSSSRYLDLTVPCYFLRSYIFIVLLRLPNIVFLQSTSHNSSKVVFLCLCRHPILPSSEGECNVCTCVGRMFTYV